MRVAENNGTGGAMMRMSRPQPVSLDKGLLGKEISSRGENMEMCVDHQLHLVSIWLPNEEKDVTILEPVYRKYKGTPYRVAVFRSGKGNLLTNTAALLKANR